MTTTRASRPWYRLQPLRLWSSSRDPIPPRLRARLFLGLLALGLAARTVRYILRFPLWEDESFLSVSLIDRGFAELMEPLAYHQVAPLLFLWSQALVVRLLGFAEMTLRLLPFLFSVLGLLMFVWLVRRLLRGSAAVLAMGFFAPAYPAIRYAAEAKPYGGDLFVSLALVCVAVAWWRQPRRVGWLWVLVALVPLGVMLSFPAVFVAGGLSLWVAAVLWARRQSDGLGPWLVMNLTLLGAVAVLFALSVRAQSAAELEFMREAWSGAFPPVGAPWKVPWWLVATHTGDLLAWPAGSARGGSALTALVVLLGGTVLVRRRHWGLLALCACPVVLHLAAAALRRYPYGGHVKFSMHLGAAICVLAGIGSASLLARLRGRADRGRGAVAALLAGLALVGVGSIARDVVHPYKTLSDMRNRAFAQWFWFDAAFDGEVRSLHTDEGLGVSPTTWTELGWSATFRCNEAIYRPVPPPRVPPEFRRDPPLLRYVLFRDQDQPFDEGVLDRWLAGMEAEHRLVARDRYALPRYDKRERHVIRVDHIELFTFAAKTGS